MDIDVVIIGVNSQATLKACIQSVLDSHYPSSNLHIFYVDGGSTDQSLPIAHSFPSVKVLQLNSLYPTPGLGRNVGWRQGTSPWIQFLDSDTILNSDWLNIATKWIDVPSVVAIRGYRNELYPERSIYNWIGNLEWNDPPGECSTFGGDVFVKRQPLQGCNGYNETLVAGEDPELSLRMRLSGGKILQIEAPMTKHDLGMLTFKQYFQRAYRSGYGFTAVYAMHAKHSSMWKRELFRILIRGGGFLICLIFAFLFQWLFIFPGLFLLFYPRLFKVKQMAAEKNLSLSDAAIYAWHCSIVVIPQTFGVLRYYLGVLFNNPLHNHPTTLKTHHTPQL